MPKVLHPDGRLAKAKIAAEIAEIKQALKETRGCVEDAAVALGVSTRGLYKRIADLGISLSSGEDTTKHA